ncbi:AAA family ATPase [Elioraea sp. Yellowstone]|jgi:chromosome partitioning protein|uniref:division plane positioning ATPase MipZ n=1 Tax=Elioraea sp. Yellowstone TaxID=2592070 RepID=UPI001152AAD7|nr:division plane positioning ATPase MipZ [Elioraea sp. Yellowstone]TQF77197.1 AAA family ATPase [Elioraea sp. Yellowstone]
MSVMQRIAVESRPHVVVLGNEKGGSGKSTAAMHVIVGLMREGYRVAAIDLDARQGTLMRYLEARAAFAAARGIALPQPAARALPASRAESRTDAAEEDAANLAQAIAALGRDAEFLVIDCPGADTPLSRAAHARADTLITPINDSFVDFSMLAKVDPDDLRVVSPSIYSEMVWEARKARFARDRGRLDWIVMRNRLGAAEARNKRDVGATLEVLAKRIGFRTVRGFGERVIFRELYLQGLTLMDLKEAGIAGGLSLSHVAARQEVRALLAAIRKGPPGDVWAVARPGAALAPAGAGS